MAEEYSVKELAAKIGYHEQTIYEWIVKRNLPAHQAVRKGRYTIVWDEFSNWWKQPKD